MAMISGGLLAAPRAAEAQAVGKRYRVAYVAIAPRTAAGRVEHYPELAREVALSQPDVIVAPSDQLLVRLKAATTTPIVGITADPVLSGLASSLSRPGGNVTGFTVGPECESDTDRRTDARSHRRAGIPASLRPDGP